MDQRAFGARIGVHNPSTLANWEGGTRMPDVIAMVRLRGTFSIPLDWIYAGSLAGLDGLTRDQLIEAAERLGAAVGGPIPEFPMQVPLTPDGQPQRTPAGKPERRPRHTTVHEPRADQPRAPGATQ